MRSVFLPAAAAVMMIPTAAMADNKSDCQKGVAMIKAELKKKHPAPVLVTLRKVLSDAETEVNRIGPSAWTTSRPRALRSVSATLNEYCPLLSAVAPTATTRIGGPT